MKVIKKYFKVALCFMAFALLSVAFAVNPSVSVYGALQNAGSMAFGELKATKMPSSVNAAEGEEFVVPALKDKTTPYTIRVYDTAGQYHDFVMNDNNAENDTTYFTAVTAGVKVNVLNNGTYRVVYIVDGVYSNTYRVKVTNVSYELDFVDANNMKALVKPTVAVLDDETDFNNWIKLPTPTVNKINGEETTTTTNSAVVKVTLDGAPATVDTTTPENGTKQVFASKEAAIAGVSAYSTANTENNVVKKRLQVVEISTGDDAGLYVIPSEEVQFAVTYSYNAGANRPSTTYTINVVEDFEAPTELTVKTPTLPSFELGDKDIELPKLTVSDKYNSNVAYNINKITIAHETNSNVYLELTNNDLTFDMTKEAFSRDGFTVSTYETLAGNYKITYSIVDAYGNEKEVTYKKEKVTISSNPTVYMAYDYTVTTTEGVKTVNADSVNTSYDVDLKAEFKNGNIVVPAAYAEDKISSYNDLFIVRTLVDSATKEVYYIDNVKYEGGKLVALDSWDNKNYAITETITDENAKDVDVSKAQAFKFEDGEDMSGKTFILRYQAYSKNVKSRSGKLVSPTTSSEYTFKVVGTETKGSPEIKITNLSSETFVKSGETVSIKVSATDATDSRLATRVFTIDGEVADVDALKDTIKNTAVGIINGTIASDYSYGKANIFDYDAFRTTIIETGKTASVDGPYATLTPVKLVEGEKNVYSFEATKQVTIVAVTISDNGEIETAVTTKLVTIKNTTETGSPAGELVEGSLNASYKVGETITLPTLRFTDTVNSGEGEIDNSLALSLAYYITPNDTTLKEAQYYYPENYTMFNNTISGAKITLTKEGTYTVIYSAMDDAGNITSYTTSFVVSEVKKPIIKVDVTGENVEYVDGVVKAESGSIIKFETEVLNLDANATMQILNSGLYYEDLGDNQYQFFGAGEYTVRFNAEKGTDKAEQKELKIKISAVELEWTDEFKTVPEYANLDEVVFLPMATTNDGSKIDVKVTFGKDGEEVTTTYVNDGWTFVADQEGVYYVQYTAENENYVLDDSTSQFTINVGDNVSPKITSSQKAKLSQDIIYDGTNKIEYKLTIDSSNRKLYLDVVSNGEYIFNHFDTGLSVTDKNDAGEQNNNTLTLWRTVKVELTSEKSIVEDGEENQWFITGTGECTLKITAEDKNNVGELAINFNVVRKTEAESNKDTVVGIVLIVTSLVVLAGVIAYFAFSGKKGGSSKRRSLKVDKIETVEEKVESKVSEEKVEETKEAEVEEAKAEESTEVENSEETETEAKSGDVE